MFYRQKILLGIVEACGGELASTDLEKLLFLYCQTTKQDHYEFFPYKYGAFSFVSYIDITKLTEMGILQKEARIKLIGSQSYLSQLRPLDHVALHSFVQKTKNLRGRGLIRKTYLDFPQFAVRSEVANTIFTAEEYEIMRQQWGINAERSLFTLGYEGRTIDGYLKREFFDTEVANTLLETREFSLWKEVKDFCFSVIKGKKTPLNFKFILRLSKENTSRLLQQEKLPYSLLDVQGLYLNLKFDGQRLECITGTSMSLFTMDKSLEQAWDKMVQKFFQRHEIAFEIQ